LAASVRYKLTELARKQGEEFQLVLTRNVIERLLYRLSCSRYRDEFVLTGAMLFRLWTGQPHRPTRDLDLLDNSAHSVDQLVEVFKEVCRLLVEEDGLRFNGATLWGERIREDQLYQGVRIHGEARLGQARIRLRQS
jgi:hypothetical protein